MAQTVKLVLSTLLGILGWHGVFLLFLIVAFKLFLLDQSEFGCPCTWSVAYGTIMFLLPSFTSYMLACFAYFQQDNDSVPWKVLKKLYEFKFACHYYDERTEWDYHAEHCIRCKQLKRDWTLVKIAVSAVFSFLYPLVWLSLTFLQASYYACADIGPNYDVLTTFCDVKVLKPDDYKMAYGLAIIRSKAIGSVLFVSTLFFVGLFVILYGQIKRYLWKKYDWSPSGTGANLQVQVSILPGRSSGSVGSTSPHSNRDTPVASVPEAVETDRQSPNQPPAADGSKSIQIHLSNTFAETIQGCLQDGVWQGIDIRCAQREEGRSLQGSYAPFRPPSRARIQQQRTGEHSYESLPQMT